MCLQVLVASRAPSHSNSNKMQSCTKPNGATALSQCQYPWNSMAVPGPSKDETNTNTANTHRANFKWHTINMVCESKEQTSNNSWDFYHPPYWSINPTNSIFIDEIIELLTEILPASNNHIILGDFNIHINDNDDVDAQICSESMEGLGLKQHSITPTHKSNNILNLVFTEILSNISVEVVESAIYISDHCPVIATLNIKKEQVKQVQRLICKAAKISQDEWNQEFNRLNTRWDSNLSCLVNQLNNELVRVYDVLAPPNQVSSFLRTKQPWYDSEMKEFKKSDRHHKWKWLKYRLDSCWRAYRNVRNKYLGKLKYKKKTSIQQKIQDCKNDTKKLHRLVTHLTGTEPQNQLPDDDSNNDKDLANSFTDFFQSKIEKIHEMFVGIEAYNPESSSIPKLCQFTPVTKSEVKTIIMAMKSKSCETDPIPTHIFKQLLPSVIPTVTKIVNLSLSEGEFCNMWKVAVVRPLLRKGLEPIKPNYSPVSNLTFMSKIIEKCMLHQLKNHCNTYDLLPDYQSAYCENYSCETCLLQLTNDIKQHYLRTRLCHMKYQEGHGILLELTPLQLIIFVLCISTAKFQSWNGWGVQHRNVNKNMQDHLLEYKLASKIV